MPSRDNTSFGDIEFGALNYFRFSLLWSTGIKELTGAYGTISDQNNGFFRLYCHTQRCIDWFLLLDPFLSYEN